MPSQPTNHGCSPSCATSAETASVFDQKNHPHRSPVHKSHTKSSIYSKSNLSAILGEQKKTKKLHPVSWNPINLLHQPKNQKSPSKLRAFEPPSPIPPFSPFFCSTSKSVSGCTPMQATTPPPRSRSTWQRFSPLGVILHQIMTRKLLCKVPL